MKSTILNINKRVLVVETPRIYDYYIYEDALYIFGNDTKENFRMSGKFDLICKGSELSEEIAKGLVVGGYCSSNGQFLYKYYNALYDDEDSCTSALDSFISAIEASNYYWEKNPIEKPAKNDLNGSFFTMQTNFHQEKAFDEAESKTFHPDRTLIFEIL
ncbi:hypothetical protein [Epilithonimonas xixisoli]|uniref:Uncharacterized protein n=1 Tax=Epilithonimonas xixisoli TaxID=1476462 RepID=A0A4R8IEZ1_9FLAO|nr:hypothetical protein [Epilithonimonas xixisoli]TDX83974.1 hypothetical protein B0I22_1562 [Epilithonimonas xixisoli]